MKIALISVLSDSIPDQLYSQYIQHACWMLKESGHEMTVFSIDESQDSGRVWPDGVDVKHLELPEQSHKVFYLDHQQPISDELLRMVLAEQNVSPFDVIEMPLWGGVGFSLVRAKRLLNEFKETKLVVNAISAAFIHADKTEQSLSMVLQNEMEQYCVRGADVIASPFEPLGDQIKLKYGRSDVKYYDGSAFSTVLESVELDAEGCKPIIDKMLNQHEPTYVPISIEEIYSCEGKKRFARTARQVKITAVIPFLDDESFRKFLDALCSLPHLTIEKLVYCSNEDESVRAEFQMLDLEDVVKIQTANSAVSLDEVLNSCSGDYLIFLRDGVSLSPDYLPRAVFALEQNSDISAIGSYSFGDANMKIPFGTVTGLTGICNTCAMWGNVFRTSKLRQLDANSNGIVWQGNDWSLLLSLLAKYQLLDVMPFSGLRYDMDQTEVNASLSSQEILGQMAAFPRVWSSFSSRLLRLLIEDRDLLNPVVSSENGICPVHDLALQSLPSTEPQTEKTGDDLNDPSGLIVPGEEMVLDGTPIPEAFSPEDDSEISASLEIETNLGDSELPNDAVDKDLEDSTDAIPKKNVSSLKTEEDFASISSNQDEYLDSPEDKFSSSDSVGGVDEQTDPVMSLPEDEPDGPISFEEESPQINEAPSDIDGGSIGFDEKLSDEVDDDENDEGEDWREFPESSEITRLGEESDDNTLSSIEENAVAITPLSLAKPGPDGEFGMGARETDDDDPLDWFQVFWSPDEDFIEENSVFESYNSAETHALEIRIEADAPVSKLRLDPSNRKGKFALRRIEIWNAATHLPVYTSSEENAFDNLLPSGDFEVEGIVQDSLVLDALGRDPQILIDIPESDADRMIISVEFNFIRENTEAS